MECRLMNKTILMVGICVLLCGIYTASADVGDWTINGNKVYVDDSKVYLSAEPHTLTESGFVYFDINTKTYTGDIDLFFGFNSDGLKPTRAYYNNNGEWINIASHFNKADYNYDEFDTWYYSNDLPVQAGNTYTIAVWMERANDICYGKYGFAIKPSSETISQAIANNHFYYLDPWWDSSWDYKIETNIINGTFPYQLPIIINSGVGTNNETNVFLYNNANSNFSDIRFLLNDTTELSYFIGDNSTDPIRVYVNVTANGTLGLYYGNPTAQDNSNGNDTFPWFDDFEDGDHAARWSNTAGTLTETGGYLDYIPVAAKYNGAYTTYTPGASDSWKIITSIQKTTNELKDIGVGQVGSENEGAKLSDRILMSSQLTNIGLEVYDTGLSTTGITTTSASLYTTPLIIEIGKVTGNGKLSVYTEGGNLLDSVSVSAQIPESTQPFGIFGANPGAQHFRLYWFAIGNYTLYEPELSWGTQLPNTPPTVPTINYPINESTHLSLDTDIMELNVSSTDVEGNNITYYFYGDQVDGSTFLGTNDSVNGNTYNWSITQYGVYYWKVYAADYMNNSNFTAVQQFTLIIPPNLTTPSNTSTEYTTYPPLTSAVSFYWQDLAAPQYRLMVAEDVNFNVMSVDTHVGTNNSNHDLLVNKQYWWKVYSYNGTTYSDSSDIYSFNLTGNSTLSGSAVEGVVYADINSVNTALPGTEVTIWNETWTDTAITGSNGYYLFTGVTDGEVYSVQAKKDLYLDSSVALVNATTDPITQDFFLLPDRTSEEWRHYVKFVVWGPAGYYEGVTVTVYENSDVTALYTAETGNDGAVTFIMDRQQEYRVTAIDASQGINRTMTLYPKDEKYLFFVASTTRWTVHEDPQSDIIDIEISTEEINSTHAYINVSYTDSLAETTTWTCYLNQSNVSTPHTQDTLQSVTNTTSTWTHSFVVNEYKGQGYWVNIRGTHTTYGNINELFSVQFEDEIGIPGIPAKVWLYVAILTMMFTAGMFGAATATEGAAIICVEGWVFLFFGWFSSIDNNGIIAVGLGFATVVAIIANINKFSKKEGHE